MNIRQYLKHFPFDTPINVVGPLHLSGSIEEPVLFVDGGIIHRIGDEGLSAGDGDSANSPMDIALSTDKDCSDLAYVLDSIPESFTEARLCGFLGGRRDHEYFNLGAAQRFLEARSQPSVIRFDDRIVGYTSGKWKFQRNGLFSIATLGDTWLTLQGACRYQCLERTCFRIFDSLGLSNVGSGEIQLESEGPVFVLFEDDLNSSIDIPQS